MPLVQFSTPRSLPLFLVLATAALPGNAIAQFMEIPGFTKIAMCRAVVPGPVRGPNEWAVPADYDGDGRFDVASKQNNGEWSIDLASNGFGAWDQTYYGFGNAAYAPLPGDYDGDGKADLSTKDNWGGWYIDFAKNNFGAWDLIIYGYGGSDFTPLPSDYDGDCKVDLAAKDSTGKWYIDFAFNDFGRWDAVFSGYGAGSPVAVPADYDGDRRSDLSVKDHISGNWFIDFAANGFGRWDVSYPGFGNADYTPVPADYDGDRKTDLASRDAWDMWLIDFAANGFGKWDAIFKGFASSSTYRPVQADYTGDGKVDLASRTDDGNWFIDFAHNNFGVWDQAWNSNVTIYAGPGLTAEDILKFDSKWMQPNQVAMAEMQARAYVYNRFDGGVWETNDRMEAMVRMYETTRQRRYLDHLRVLIDGVLMYRDDRHPGPLSKEDQTEEHQRLPPDQVRGGSGLPAWGGKSPSTANLYSVNETVSSLYAHPIAAFARIVAEDPGLQGMPISRTAPGMPTTYGAAAIAYADAVLETVNVFMPQVRHRSVGSFTESYLVQHPNLAKLLNVSSCGTVADAAIRAGENESRTNQQRTNCINSGINAGRPIAHNENGAFLMVLIEMSRALDSAFLRSSMTSGTAEAARAWYPLFVSRGHRYFANKLTPVGGDSYTSRYRWNHVDDQVGGGTRFDDASHAALSMRYISLLNRDLARLNTRLAAYNEPILLDATYLRRFANTFLYMTRTGHISDDVGGDLAASPIDSRDYLCQSWTSLANGAPAIYDRCLTITLRVVSGIQPYLTVANHADMLADKAARYPKGAPAVKK